MNVASCLRSFKSEIIEEWKQTAQEMLPAARGRPPYVLLDSIGDFLDEIIEYIEYNQAISEPTSQSAKAHALQRATLSDYSLEQVIREYRILGRVIFKTLDRELVLEPHERNIIFEFIQEGTAAAAQNYANFMLGREHQASLLLRQAEARLKLAIDSANIGIFDWDPRTDKLYWSDRLKKLWAYRPNEFPGTIEGFWKRVHPEDRAEIEQAIRDSFEHEKKLELVYRIVWPDNSIHWISVQGRATFDDLGNVSHLAGAASEVTERVEAEQKLKKSEELFRLVSRATQDLIWDWNLETNQIQWNEALSTLFGYPELTLKGASSWWFENMHPADRERVSQEIRAAIDRGDSRWIGSYRFKRADESFRSIIDRAFLIRNRSGKAIRMVGAMQDITERMHAEQQIQEIESRFRTIFENAPIGIAEIDPISRKLIHVNQKFCEMLGYTQEELLQKTITEITYPGDPQLDHATSERLNRGDVNEIRHETRYFKKSGEIIWAEISVSIIRERDGKPKVHIAVALDITQRKQSEERLISALQQLQEERTVRERFVSTLTHDLRIPLTSAKMSTQIAARSADDPNRVISLTSKALDAIDRTDQMIHDLLDVSQINAGLSLAIKPELFDFSRLVREVCEELTATYGAEFRFEAPKVLTGYWSYRELRRAVENLASNAAKYGDPSKPITMRLKRTNEHIELSVHNFGQTISAKDQPYIFDTFLRAQTSSGKSKGWGLGLSLVKGVVEAHHGQIRLESSDEKGTTFTILLPLDFRTMQKAAS